MTGKLTTAGGAAARTVRVATAQFQTGKDTGRVLGQILQLIDEASAGGGGHGGGVD